MSSRKNASLAYVAALSLLSASAQTLPPGAPVTASFPGLGSVLGVKNSSLNAHGVAYFLGVPFAATTAGDNSFRAPQPRAPWAPATLNGTQFAPGCLQPHHNADVPPTQSYDCLSLNVYVPADSIGTSSKLPVMVFFNGGAWLEGSDEGPLGLYSGASLASKHGVIVCAANYRLGAFGWLAGLTDIGINGNFGTLDQIAALSWVRDNIGAVGGDPTRVTLFGESAGAMSIGILMTSPRAKGLFSRAIMESNVAGFNYKNESEAAIYAATFCSEKGLNCSVAGKCSAECLRAASPGAIMDAWNTATGDVGDFILTDLPHILDGLLGTGPVLDGDVVQAEPLSFVEGGDYWAKGIPLMLGTNSNEGETFIYDGVDFPLPGFLIPLAYESILGFNATAAELVNGQPRYNTSAYPDGRTPLSQMVTDMWFRCSSERFLFSADASARYAYRYDHKYSNASIFPTFGLPEICAEVVCHASELPFVFDELPGFTGFTSAEAQLADKMGRLWTTFAKGESIDAAEWPVWEPSKRSTLVFNLTSQVESSSDICDFWDSLADAYFW
jgi:para-nitrobenzyl esterase